MDENQSVQMTFVVYPVCVNTCPTKEISTKMKKRGEPDGWRIKASKWLFLSINLFLGKSMLMFKKIGS